MEFDKDPTLHEWTREQPLAVLALDSADRAVLRIAVDDKPKNGRAFEVNDREKTLKLQLRKAEPYSPSTMRHGGEIFFLIWSGSLIRIEERLRGECYRDSLQERAA
ncbi:hypothetical protein Trydic_g2210 [Trypoxylus dichotomus]